METTQQPKLDFINTAKVSDNPAVIAETIRKQIKFDLETHKAFRTWEEALRGFIKKIDEAGILVMMNGIVGSNIHRSLDTKEFRGFALVDEYAPLIFINNKDSKSAQMFTLAHELGHLWLGVSGLSNAGAKPRQGKKETEIWCNKVAAELLVPQVALFQEFKKTGNLNNEVERLTAVFKVSKLVILLRLFEAEFFSRKEFNEFWETEIRYLKRKIQERKMKSGNDGNFHKTLVSRIGKRFTSAVINQALEGNILYLDACQMLGTKNIDALTKIKQKMEGDV